VTDPRAAGEAERIRTRELRSVAGRQVYFDAEGFFWDPDDWSDSAAEELARESGTERLDEVQWRVIRVIRAYYLANGRAPMNRELKAGTELSLVELEQLFPDGIRMGARRLAGLPNPKTCLD
jgi:TusE/DsrC/DsvC family sulfur relay protein